MKKNIVNFEASLADFGIVRSSTKKNNTAQSSLCDDCIDMFKTYLVSDKFSKDLNPIIQDEIIKDRLYITLNKVKVADALSRPTFVTDIFDDNELRVLADQCLHEGVLSTKQHALIKEDISKFDKYINASEVKVALDKQDEYELRVPNMKHLEDHGLLQSIENTIIANPDVLINLDLIEKYTSDFLDKKLKDDNNIGAANLELLLSAPSSTLDILTLSEFKSLLTRTAPYLDFISLDDDFIELDKLTISSDIINIYNSNELTLIFEKEIQLKELKSKTLTIEGVEKVFNKLKDQLLNVDLRDIVIETISQESVTSDDVITWIEETKLLYTNNEIK
jgi:hypothetical protein